MANGEMAPLSQFVTLTRVYGAESLSASICTTPLR